MQTARELQLPVRVLTDRAESLPALAADVLSARALAPLPALCGLALRHLAPDGIALFPKGAQSAAELKDAAQHWHFERNTVPSKTDADGQIILIKNIRHA